MKGTRTSAAKKTPKRACSPKNVANSDGNERRSAIIAKAKAHKRVPIPEDSDGHEKRSAIAAKKKRARSPEDASDSEAEDDEEPSITKQETVSNLFVQCLVITLTKLH